MCNKKENKSKSKELQKNIQKLRGIAKALHCPPRWDIIEIIGKKTPTTKKIREKMEEKGYELSKPGLYYHLSELKDAGIIKVSGYLDEGRGAPEKKWELVNEKIEIDLLNED